MCLSVSSSPLFTIFLSRRCRVLTLQRCGRSSYVGNDCYTLTCCSRSDNSSSKDSGTYTSFVVSNWDSLVLGLLLR